MRERLARLMEPHFETVEALAQDARVSATVLRNFLKGTSNKLPFEVGVKVARSIGVTPEELALGEAWLRGKQSTPRASASAGTESHSDPAVVELKSRVDALAADLGSLTAQVKAALAPKAGARKSKRSA